MIGLKPCRLRLKACDVARELYSYVGADGRLNLSGTLALKIDRSCVYSDEIKVRIFEEVYQETFVRLF